MKLTLCTSFSASTATGVLAGVGGESASAETEQPDEPDPAGEAGWRVTLDIQTQDCDPPARGWLDTHFGRVAELAGVQAGLIHLVVLGDQPMAELHEQYKQVAGTTDVLTFDLREQPEDPIEGDIVLCMDEARHQAQDRGHDTRLELLLYAVHGLLHMLGEDDHDPADFKKMHRREDELLTRAGFGPVFRDD